MRSRDFAYWLQGFFEIAEPNEINITQVHQIKKHLNLVFKHEIDPSMGPEEHQKELNEIHNKPSLEELAEQHNLPKPTVDFKIEHGAKPAEHYLYCKINGWYDPKEGVLRC